MQDYETEDQQIEALKKWWKENSTSLFFGLALGLGGIFGWQYYNDYTTTRAQAASDLFNVVSQQVQAGEFTDINKLEQLTGEFADTPYAALAALSAAAHYFDKGDSDAAIEQYRWVLANSSIEENTHLAATRLATLYLSLGQLDEAESLLEGPHPDAFSARYAELRGDLYVARGDNRQARLAYDQAIRSMQGVATPWLQLKRDYLGEVTDTGADNGGAG